MSYSLIFMLPENSNLDLARQHSSERKNYTVSVNQADYDNEETGNRFIVDLMDEAEPDIPEIVGQHVIFQINYFRPKSYLGDVIPELRAFVSKFDCRFFDENTGQIEKFSLKSFEKSWNKTNAWAVKKLPEEEGTNCFFAPTSVVENVWRWNYRRSEAETLLGEDIYVAKVSWVRQKDTNNIQSFVVWPDSIKIIFPLFCDTVLLIRSTTKQVSLFSRILGKNDRPKDNVALFRMKDLSETGIFEKIELSGLNCLRYDGVLTREIAGLFTKADDSFYELYETLGQGSVFEDDLSK